MNNKAKRSEAEKTEDQLEQRVHVTECDSLVQKMWFHVQNLGAGVQLLGQKMLLKGLHMIRTSVKASK
jgi:hypothetical protein